MKKILIIASVIFLLALLYYFFIAKTPEAENINWGINFSKTYSEFLKLDWKENYSAILDDLRAKNVKLLVQWNEIEKEKGKYDFKDVDWQINQAEKYEANIIYVVGMKSGRWPECHLPYWANQLNKEQQQEEILQYIEKTVLRYRDQKSIVAWQAENEPFYVFGICPWYDEEFLKKEVALIKSLDQYRPVIISDTGEQSFWFKAAKIGDIVGITMYRKVWVHITDKLGFYFNFPLPAVSYFDRAQIIKGLFGKKVINIELQAEPWVPDVNARIPVEKQEETMNLNQFRKNIEYAKKSGLDTFYFWGAEWWYWMKESQQKPEIWNEAKSLLSN